MSDTINEDDSDCNSHKQKEGDECTMRDVLECVGENINPAKDILGSEAETSNTVEFHLSRTYFQNLGIIMKEYLTTTTLGDHSLHRPELSYWDTNYKGSCIQAIYL